ncbi:hypothetical protein [Profundibacter sp.]
MHRVFHFPIMALLFGLLSPLAGASQGSPAELALGIIKGDMKRVQVEIAGQKAWMLLDTGGGWSVIGPELADRTGCRPFGRVTGFRMSGEQISTPQCGNMPFTLGHMQTTGYVAAFDISALLPQGWPEIDGLLALPSLAGVDRLTLDWSANRIILETEASLATRTSGLQSGRIALQREGAGRGLTIFVEVSAKPEPLWLLLDSGNVSGNILAPHALEQLGNPAQTTGVDLTIAGQKIPALPVHTEDIIYDGNLGTDFLNRYVVSLDLTTRKIWLMAK